MKTQIETDHFGFICEPWAVEFRLGTIRPVPGFHFLLEQWQKHCHQDGFRYPDQRHESKLRPDGTWEPIPQTSRPALVYQPDSTHVIEYHDRMDLDAARKGPSGFIIQLLAFFSGCQAQFFTWWVIGRMPINGNPPFFLRPEWVQKYVSLAERTWLGLPEKQQKSLTNILYCHNRLHSYEWKWEEFAFGYMVLDAIWEFHKTHSGLNRNPPHGRRIAELCKYYDLRQETKPIEEIVGIRNDLMHESLWDREIPGFGVGVSGINAVLNLRRLSDQLIARLVGIKSELPPWTIPDSYAVEPS